MDFSLEKFSYLGFNSNPLSDHVFMSRRFQVVHAEQGSFPLPEDKLKLPKFNPFSTELREEPYVVYKRLRELNPLHKVLGMWVVTRHADVMNVLRNRACSSSIIPKLIDKQALKFEKDGAAFQRLAYKSIVFTDNPDHHRLRKLVNIAFSKVEIEKLQASIEFVAASLLRIGHSQGGMDFISGLAAPLPLKVMCHWMALPVEMHTLINDWTHAIRFLLEPGLMVADDFGKIADVLDEYMCYLASVISERKRNPKDDLISLLTQLVVDGGRLSNEELIFVCVMCFVAGNETTKSLIGNGVYSILTHSDQYDLLRKCPDLVAGGVQESLRFESPLQHTKRLATKDFIIDGQTIKEGDQILLCLGSANRDDTVFKSADIFDIQRQTKGHLAFGYGMHGCLGGLLAERQAQAVLLKLLEGPGSRLCHSSASWQTNSLIVRSLTKLDIEFF